MYLILMDRSGAIDLPGAVIPFLKGKKFILLGDPEQLPSILVERTPEVRALSWEIQQLDRVFLLTMQ